MKISKKKIFFFILLILLIVLSAVPLFALQKPSEAALNLEKRGLHPLLITGLISMLPIFELRGAIPVGIALFKQNIFIVYIVAVIFNLVPILPILYLLLPLRRFLLRFGILKQVFNFLDTKAKKNSKIVEKYGEFGLALFVAIPLPITGAWTGSLIAVSMDLSPIKSFLFITLGVLSAGVIVTFITLVGMKALILIVPLILILIFYMLFKYLRVSNKKEEK